MGSTLQSTSSLSNSCAPGLDLAISPVLLVGSPGAGTVALLFQYAHAAARAGLNVVILGSRCVWAGALSMIHKERELCMAHVPGLAARHPEI